MIIINYAMNYIFYALILISIVFGACSGNLDKVVNAILDGAELSVKIAFSLIGIMAFWLGIMKIAQDCGFVKFLAKLLRPIAKVLFKDIPSDNSVIGDITMSFTANAFGLTNAATPIGLKAMQELQKENKDKTSASDAMCMFLGMNTAGFQLVPTTVIAVLVSIGYKNPTEIILPVLIVTSLSFLSAIVIASLLKKVWRQQ